MEELTFCCRVSPPGNQLLNLRRHKTQPGTSTHDKEPRECCRCFKKKTNETPQIKFSYTSVSRLHVSHVSIIYRRPQRDVAELVLAGGSKLRSGTARRVHMECDGQDAGPSRSLGGREEEGLGAQSWWWRTPRRVLSSPGPVTCQSRDAGGQDYWQQPHRVSGCSPSVLL